MAKMKRMTERLDGTGGGIIVDGVGAMEISESRGFVTGVVDGLRDLGRSREEREAEEREGGLAEDDDMEM